MAETRRRVLDRLCTWGLLGGLAAGLPLAACSDAAEDASPEAPEAPAVQAVPQEPVREILGLEIGQTRSGIALAAFARAPAPGFSRPVLAARREGRPAPDGYLEYDFLAAPPVTPRQGEAGRLRADLLIDRDVLAGTRGLRVFGLENGRQVNF